MPRNLDLTALRSFVAVAEAGSVTRAAGSLNLTQSAVSMQIKRLEEFLGQVLMDRTTRRIGLTAEGEKLVSYARRMLKLNDEVYGVLTGREFEGQIVLGVPHDIVYPAIPGVLRQIALRYPRVRIQLLSSFTLGLKDLFARGEADMILTTEDGLDPGGETLSERRLVWIGAPDGEAWKSRPLRLAFEDRCIFRPIVQRRLDAAGIDWIMAVETATTRTVEATVSADLAVHAMLEGTMPQHTVQIDHGGALPDLGGTRINLYHNRAAEGPLIDDLAQIVRAAFAAQSRPRAVA